MTTTTLSSKKRFQNLLFGMMKKNVPTAIYLFAIMFFFFPLQMLLDTIRVVDRMTDTVGWNPRGLQMGIYTDVSIACVTGILLMSAVIIGLVQSTYLHQKRAVDLYHSLPVTRTQLMSANVLTGFLTVIVPFLVNYILNFCVLLYRNSILGSAAQPISGMLVFGDIFGWLVSVFAILSVVMLVSTQVGSIFENFVFSCELLAAPMIIIGINELLCEVFLIGYNSSMNYKTILSSSPIGVMIGFYTENMEKNPGDSPFFIFAILVWLLLGIAIFFGALALYRRRKSEIAECPGCKGMLGALLTAVAVYIGGIGIGSLLHATIDGGSENTFLACTFIGAVLVFVLVEAVLNRGFSGIRKTLPFGAVCCIFVLAATFAITSGGFGYETRTPATDKVDTVTFDYRGWCEYVTELDASTKVNYGEKYGEPVPRYSYNTLSQVVLKTPESIELVKQIHLSMVEDARNNKDNGYYRSRLVQYKLQNGKTMLRRYDSYGEETIKLMQQLGELPEFQQQTNPLLRVKPEWVKGISLNDSLGFEQKLISQNSEIKAILEALRKDAEANGTKDFTAGAPVLGYIYVNTGGEDYTNIELTENHITNFSVPVFESYRNVTAVLSTLGYGTVMGSPNYAEITAVGVSEYFDGKSSDTMVSGVDDYTRQKQDYNYLMTDLSKVEQILSGATRFEMNSRNYSPDRTYLTLYKGDEQGVTVMISAGTLSDELRKQLFPNMDEKTDLMPMATHESIG